jgi:hypothetical protein
VEKTNKPSDWGLILCGLSASSPRLRASGKLDWEDRNQIPNTKIRDCWGHNVGNTSLILLTKIPRPRDSRRGRRGAEKTNKPTDCVLILSELCASSQRMLAGGKPDWERCNQIPNTKIRVCWGPNVGNTSLILLTKIPRPRDSRRPRVGGTGGAEKTNEPSDWGLILCGLSASSPRLRASGKMDW